MLGAGGLMREGGREGGGGYCLIGHLCRVFEGLMWRVGGGKVGRLDHRREAKVSNTKTHTIIRDMYRLRRRRKAICCPRVSK